MNSAATSPLTHEPTTIIILKFLRNPIYLQELYKVFFL